MSEEKDKDDSQAGREDRGQFPTLSSPGSSGEADDGSTELLGSMVGRYKLLSILGKGGFGIVYLAEQKEPIRRQVALKVIKPGMDSRQVIARFEAERQALAFLDHPNIAHIYDGGTTDAGRPFFVMEYVEGTPITEYCDEHKLSIKERLELFEQVCKAAQHAHQKGIIHRDIKPSNVLVSLLDDKPVPKIIDFGIAKAVSQSLTKRTFTEQGQFIGTPEYMSPEQATLTNQDIDTRSDVYSLGVLLYELLTGTLPFESSILRQVAFDERLRIIREEDPPRPSTRLSGLGEEAQKIAECRQTEAAALAKRLHKELEWIPLKAIRKEPDRRYKTASELADDVRSYLNGDPLTAGPESRNYRLRKAIKRHRVVVMSIAAILVVLIVGIIVSASFAALAIKAKNAEQMRAEDYRRTLYFNNIISADDAYHSGNIRRTCELLKSCPIDLRDWEWFYICGLVKEHAKMRILNHKEESRVQSLTFSPKGDRLASSAIRGNTAEQKIWQVETGRELANMTEGNLLAFFGVRFSPDGNAVISSVSPNKQGICMEMWNSTTGEIIKNFSIENIAPSLATAVGFSPDGKIIAAGIMTFSGDNFIGLWNVESTLLIDFVKQEDVVQALAFNIGGEKLVYAVGKGTVKVSETSMLSKSVILGKNLGVVKDLLFNAKGTNVVCGLLNGTLIEWNVETQAIEKVFKTNHETQVMAIGAEGTLFAVAQDELLKVWNLETSSVIASQTLSELIVSCIEFDPTGRELAVGASDGTIRLWRIGGNKNMRLIPPPPIMFQDYVRGFSLSPDNKYLAWFEKNSKEVKVWDLSLGKQVTSLNGLSKNVEAIAFGKDSKLIISLDVEGTTRIWNIRLNSELAQFCPIVNDLEKTNREIVGPDGLPWFDEPRYKISGNGQLLMYYCPGRAVRIWDISAQNEIITIKAGERDIVSAGASQDNVLLALGSSDGSFGIWDLTTGANVAIVGGHLTEIRQFGFTSNGLRLVTLDTTGNLKVWNTGDWSQMVTVPTGDLYSFFSISPNGNRFAIARNNGSVTIHDMNTGVQLLVLDESASDMAFSQDGRCIVLAKNEIRILDSVSSEEANAWEEELSDTKKVVKPLTTISRKQGTYIPYNKIDRFFDPNGPILTKGEIEQMTQIRQGLELVQRDSGLAIVIGGETLSSDQIIESPVPLGGRSVPPIEYFRAVAQASDFRQFKERAHGQLEDIVRDRISNMLLYQCAKKQAGENVDKVLQKAAENEYRKLVLGAGGDQAKADETLKRQGSDRKSYMEYLKRSILVNSYLISKSPDKTELTYHELMDCYNQMKDKFFAKVARITFRLIDIQPDKLKATDPNGDRLRLATELATGLLTRIRSGEDFGRLAKQYSHDDWREFGGLWKPVQPEALPAPYDVLATEAKKIAPGQVSEPIITKGHIFIMKLEEKEPGGYEPFEKVQRQVEEHLLFDRRNEFFRRFNAEIRGQAELFEIDRFVDSCIDRLYESSSTPRR